jgi:hypothetical protein
VSAPGERLDSAGRNRAPRASKVGTKTTKQLIEAHGAEEYEFYVTLHVQKHMTLGRHISSWWGCCNCKSKRVETRVESAWFQRSKLQYYEVLSDFAFTSNLQNGGEALVKLTM